MADVERAVSYFACCGEANTEKVLDAVRRRCEERGPGIVVVDSETGRSALRSLEAFRGLPIELVVVTHFPAKTQGPRGDIPIGLGRPEYADARRRLLEEGASIVKWTSPFAPPTRSIGWNFPTLETVVDKTLEVFGAGTKIAVEAAVIAADAGEVAEGE